MPETGLRDTGAFGVLIMLLTSFSILSMVLSLASTIERLEELRDDLSPRLFAGFWSANNVIDVLLNLIDGIVAHLDD